MKVREAIEMLSKNYSPEEEICISWWDKWLFFDEDEDSDVDIDAAWSAAVDEFDAEEGYSFINQRVYEMIIDVINDPAHTKDA